jgi:hypothetical protein
VSGIGVFEECRQLLVISLVCYMSSYMKTEKGLVGNCSGLLVGGGLDLAWGSKHSFLAG